VSKNLQLVASGRQKTAESPQVIGAFSLPTPVQTPAAYKRAKFPYDSVNRPPKHESVLGQQKSVRYSELSALRLVVWWNKQNWKDKVKFYYSKRVS